MRLGKISGAGLWLALLLFKGSAASRPEFFGFGERGEGVGGGDGQPDDWLVDLEATVLLLL